MPTNSVPLREDTNHFNRDGVLSGKPDVVNPLDPKNILGSFEKFEVRSPVGKTVLEIRELLLDLASKQDPRLEAHLKDSGLITKRILNDRQFQLQAMAIVTQHYGKERTQELQDLFKEETIERMALGSNIHDIGKFEPKVNELINATGKLSLPDKEAINSHTGVQTFLDLLEIEDPLIRITALYHHAPYYYGADPFSEKDQLYNPDHTHEEAQMNLPFHVMFAKWVDIFHAMIEDRPYRKRGMIIWEETRKNLSPEHPLASCYTVEAEMRKKSPEDRERGGHLIKLFLGTIERNWETLKEELTAEVNLLNISRKPESGFVDKTSKTMPRP